MRSPKSHDYITIGACSSSGWWWCTAIRQTFPPGARPGGSVTGRLQPSFGRTRLHKTWNHRGRAPAIASFSHLESDALFGCGAGNHHLFIDAVGNACPCDLTPLGFGNVCEEPLYDIWSRMGEWFPLPRRGCLVRDLREATNVLPTAATFPLCRPDSEALCRQHLRKTPLPAVFANLFRDRKPTNPPANYLGRTQP